MILSFSHENVWTTKGPVPTDHKPYFLIRDTGVEIPKVSGVTDISAPFEMRSWVKWSDKVQVRRVYIEHPSVTPRVSSVYYGLGFETYENSVPYLNRVAADLEVQGKWPFASDEWVTLKALIFDIEQVPDRGTMPCVGLGEFDIQVKGHVDLENEEFDFDTKIGDNLKVTQLLADTRGGQLENIYKPLVEKFKESHMTIGHNIIEYDTPEIYDKIKEYSYFNDFLVQRMYEHEGFQRGKHSKRMIDIRPFSFDTLLAARFIWKGESDVGYGLKQLAQKFKIKVHQTDADGYVQWDRPVNRVYENAFRGFGNWSNHDKNCLDYNNHDIQETYGIFKMQANAILINMFISGLNFEDVVSGSNGRLADHLSLIRGHNKIINPPMQHPSKVAKALHGHFKDELKTKKEIFDYFKDHKCSWDCVPVVQEDKFEVEEPEDEEDENNDDTEGDTPGRLQEKLMRVVKYGSEMPDYVEYYPFLFSPYSKKEQKKDPKKRAYIAVGGKTVDPTEPMEPRHDVYKADVSAQYPTILKARNITSDVIKLSRKGDRVDGWCWFRTIYNKDILKLFEWRPAADFKYSDGEGYFIGYYNRNQEGLLNKALTGIIKVVGTYKKKPGWDEAYQKTLKPMRNALTHGVLLALDATCQQYNIAGCAIPTLGQEITTYMNSYLVVNGWKILESDTDGTEFRKLVDDAKPFKDLVEDVNKYWTDKLNFILTFEDEHSKHKLFIAHKNYVTIKDNDEVKLTGNTLHAADKPKIAEKVMKKLILEVLPKTNTKDQLLGMVHQKAYPIVHEMFKDIDLNDLVIRQFVKPPDHYPSVAYKERSEAIERILGKPIVSPGTKFEFLVCKDRLPGTHGDKTLSDPISFMWPREIVEAMHKEVDYEWGQDMTFSYLDTAFKFVKVSTKHYITPLFGFETSTQQKIVRAKKQETIADFSTEDEDDPLDSSRQKRLF